MRTGPKGTREAVKMARKEDTLTKNPIKCYKCNRKCKYVCKIVAIKEGTPLYGLVYCCPTHGKWVWYRQNDYPSESMAKIRSISPAPNDPAFA